jgi:hypothetical protein
MVDSTLIKNHNTKMSSLTPFEITEFTSSKFSLTSNNFVNIYHNKINFNDEIISKLLIQYKALMLSFACENLLTSIPKYITKLALNLSDYSNIILQTLPSGLNELYIFGEDADFDNILDNLPIELEILVIESSDFNKPVNILPLGLKTLVIHSDLFNQSIDDLPQNLEILEITTRFITTFNDFSYTFMNLPQNLKTLITCTTYFNNTNYQECINAYPNLEIYINKKQKTKH